jgi:putative selenate reductase
MSDRFHRISIEKLLKWILAEEDKGRIFGIYKDLFYTPKKSDSFRMNRYNKTLETPIGVAAGPHTQLAHNIIASWLCGARYIELKTIQTLDEIDVTKPCIDMEDEGYNCEWSQELKIKDSFDEYLNAWIIIHVLKNKFGWDTSESGFIFNMSVGYDLEGIKKPNVQWFLDKMKNCRKEKEEKIKKLESFYPNIHEVNIPDQISDNVTLSTMHGCPSNEIEKICRYLIEEKKLRTSLKLNPTLLGKEALRNILNDKLGYEITVPDDAFEHDLKYDDAIRIINSIKQCADITGVEFGLKLTNTLEASNSTNWLPDKEKMVYTSGRALHPISIKLAEKLQSDFSGELDISFSAGVDAFNAADTLACNLKPITVCSNLLKPGGYPRLTQYLEEIQKSIKSTNQNNIDDFIKVKGNDNLLSRAGLQNLKHYAGSVLENKSYHKNNFLYENIKTNRTLTEYDCIHAPCIEECAVSQDVPEYMYHTANGNFEKAFESILKDNPLPNMTGNVCDHLCQSKCTRINYDNPLLIRGIKRFVSEKFNDASVINKKNKNGLKAAVIGAGPSGLSCAYFLALQGFEVNLYESKSFAGGMVSGSIPEFRLSDKSINDDIEIIKSSGVQFHFSQKVDEELFSDLQKINDYLYIGIGAQKSKRLNIPGEELFGVTDQLTFLSKIRQNENVILGNRVAVIGGGLSAIDAARTAKRLIGNKGKVIMLYRRTKAEMPASLDEITALLDEGVELLELVAPVSIHSNHNSKLSIKCTKMQLKGTDESGRRKPVPVTGSEFILEFDNIITAIGQDVELDFVPEKKIILNNKTYETQFPNVFAGGDAIRGANSLINAMSDGKKAAEQIIQKAIEREHITREKAESKLSLIEFQKKLSHREYGIQLPEIQLEKRTGFDLVHPVLDEDVAIKEAQRCLFCNDVCNICIGVCPNFANVGFTVDTIEIPVYLVSKNGEKFTVKKERNFSINQSNQILTIGDFCNECGNCNTFCPTSGAPYKTKPMFYLTEESFNNEAVGYYYKDGVLKFKNNGSLEVLSVNENYLTFESDQVFAKISKDDFSINEIRFKSESVQEISLSKAAEMFFLIKNLSELSVFK